MKVWSDECLVMFTRLTFLVGPTHIWLKPNTDYFNNSSCVFPFAIAFIIMQ